MAEEDIEFITFDGDNITKSDYRDEIINQYISANMDGMTKITDFTIGSEAYHLADVMATFLLEHREMIDTNYRMSMIHTCEGEFLDNFGDMAGVHRHGSSPSTGSVLFSRLNTDTTDAITIPDGTQVSTDDAISFIVDNDGDDLVLEGERTSIEATVICEQDGAYTNVLPNTITLVMGDIGNLVSVVNENEMTGGEDIEDDEDYRARILLSPYEVPVGTLAWYENVALTASHNDENNQTVYSIHDVKVEKGITQSFADVIITYNPTDWTDTSIAANDLESLFSMKEYDVAGITTDFVLCSRKAVLVPTQSVNYLFAVLLDTNYTLDMVKDAIIAKINQFNKDAMISVEFSPSSLASIIENEITGVMNCRIIKEEGGSYTEIIEPISMTAEEIYQIETENIDNRIVLMHFNIDIDVDESTSNNQPSNGGDSDDEPTLDDE